MKNHRYWMIALVLFAFGLGAVGCSKDDDNDDPMGAQALDPNTAPRVSIDRFSATAGHLFVRDGSNGLPAANAAINMDQAPFITHGWRPQGGMVSYYNFDVMPLAPAPIYVLKRASDTDPVAGQLNIVDVIPGEVGYNDFWQPMLVTVPDDYVANTIHSYQQIVDMSLMMTPLDAIVNCPIVPEGSTGTLGGAMNGLTRGWYDDEVVFYFNFDEKALAPVNGLVPISPILVCFNINPDEPGGGPASGFKVEQDNMMQTHNVVMTLPADPTYSPLWDVNAYCNQGFHQVMDWMSAEMIMPAWNLGAFVNCPVVAQ